MKPTDEQIKGFYTKILDGKVEFGTIVNCEIACYRRTTWNKEDEEWNIEVIPRTDSLEYPGWLFKYAVPELLRLGGFDRVEIIFFSNKTRCILTPFIYADDFDKDPALALFGAIFGVIK